MSATATVDTSTAITARTAGGRLGALAGLAFAFLFFMGTAMLDLPHGVSDEKMVAWWSDSGHQLTVVVSMYLFVLAGLCFLVFLAKLRSRLLAAEGGTGELTSLVVAGGAVFVAMLFVAAASRGGIGFAIKAPGDDELLPGADTLRYYPTIGYAALGAGGLLAAAVAMATTSWLICEPQSSVAGSRGSASPPQSWSSSRTWLSRGCSRFPRCSSGRSPRAWRCGGERGNRRPAVRGPIVAQMLIRRSAKGPFCGPFAHPL